MLTRLEKSAIINYVMAEAVIYKIYRKENKAYEAIAEFVL